MQRRSLLLAAGASAVLTACGQDPAAGPNRPGVSRADVELLNEALAFEHVEAAFYAAAAARDERFAELAAQEAEHVAALTRAVRDAGGRPVGGADVALRLPARDAVPALALRIEERRAAASLDLVSRLGNPGLLAAGLALHAVEARHVIALRELAGVALAPTEAFGAPARGALEEVRTWLA
ncbi:ferritin-like domain-containing protein [Solirubrobacter sp. CPCC 204708]|uniref:Ferritin-like domain-containing protein n=1 Tax=Solirubrobacter deserti TaxID=2282478 RepID=A0ABT4RV78_9ACTN|nr:ferritin-like domain-containing protein [Solirubrobacter deserti]MBE2314775.1 ferritin-like domain-containing protein [Solirubrobacter deserti]MDA0142165.1 ferritin-like domain-containing protein [Solirubrobacter deserti]